MRNIVAIMSLLALFGACSSAPEKLDDRKADINQQYEEDVADLKEERDEDLQEAEEEYREEIRDYKRERAHDAIDDSDSVEYDEDGNKINLED